MFIILKFKNVSFCEIFFVKLFFYEFIDIWILFKVTIEVCTSPETILKSILTEILEKFHSKFCSIHLLIILSFFL